MSVFCEHGKLVTRCRVCSPKTVKPSFPASPRVFVEDRNLAFKCNWLDSDYEGPCGRAGRMWNIYRKRFPWCTQPENPCYQYENGFRNDIPEFPCYETMIFKKSEFGAGVDHSGPRKGTGRKIKYVVPGKLAIFTTVEPNKPESERLIFGFFVIRDHYTDEEGATRIVGYPEYTLKIPKDSRLEFWDFYRNSDGSIFWGTGLFRYLSDKVVVNYLKKQREVLIERGYGDKAEVVSKILSNFFIEHTESEVEF
ncbi:hypothetical protein GAH_00829 [Geoglobus ahangari]|uniref:Uncharacterized protein n=1 Tax=Geoglobus ahangari TaxID=113653 RepID=A0A0F7IFE4_9EURY|nr:hypothetical protein [Geoglobus ahangari]AKG91840.1 hypothetical protein GAH_00829 [Geoglobus ahangari]